MAGVGAATLPRKPCRHSSGPWRWNYWCRRLWPAYYPSTIATSPSSGSSQRSTAGDWDGRSCVGFLLIRPQLRVSLCLSAAPSSVPFYQGPGMALIAEQHVAPR
jgi:hypothetical protein